MAERKTDVQFQFIVIEGPNRGDVFLISDTEPLQIGRSKSTPTNLQDRHCSRLHCTAEISEGKVTLTDCESRTGTFVNGFRIEKTVLDCGDIIQTGETKFQLVAEGAISSAGATSTTLMVQRCLDRYHQGDEQAGQDLIQAAWGRLYALAGKMFHREDRLHRWVDVEDVLQNALVRLWSSLRHVKPTSVRELYGLAATQIRRELIDLARHYFGAWGTGANHESRVQQSSSENAPDPHQEQQDTPEQLQKWTAFHEAVEALPPMEGEIVSLLFYHGWLRADVAELLQISVRTVRNRWQNACRLLRDAIKDPPLDLGIF